MGREKVLRSISPIIMLPVNFFKQDFLDRKVVQIFLMKLYSVVRQNTGSVEQYDDIRNIIKYCEELEPILKRNLDYISLKLLEGMLLQFK